mmetsp:Transcript_15548/g.15333  ORF Transcript_15548/g.15333 Transcript_15548/m.15333 type:complete len:105 (+) Transcript_15548:44-358(+)
MGRKDDRRSRSKSHENKWRPPKEESPSDDEGENQEPGFLGSLTAEERLELEKRKDEAGLKQYAKAFIEKEKRDQWQTFFYTADSSTTRLLLPRHSSPLLFPLYR